MNGSYKILNILQWISPLDLLVYRQIEVARIDWMIQWLAHCTTFLRYTKRVISSVIHPLQLLHLFENSPPNEGSKEGWGRNHVTCWKQRLRSSSARTALPWRSSIAAQDIQVGTFWESTLKAHLNRTRANPIFSSRSSRIPQAWQTKFKSDWSHWSPRSSRHYPRF